MTTRKNWRGCSTFSDNQFVLPLREHAANATPSASIKQLRPRGRTCGECAGDPFANFGVPYRRMIERRARAGPPILPGQLRKTHLSCPPSSPVSRPRRPASCISAARGRLCSTGSTPSASAASSCCASRTPTASARRMQRRRDPRRPALARLEWDGEAVSQFRARRRHREVAEQLLASGTPIAATRGRRAATNARKARLEGKPMRYDGRWRDRDPAEAPAASRP